MSVNKKKEKKKDLSYLGGQLHFFQVFFNAFTFENVVHDDDDDDDNGYSFRFFFS